jgi:hypothetical protein
MTVGNFSDDLERIFDKNVQLYTGKFDKFEQFRELGRQLMEEQPAVLSQLSEPLAQLKANIDAVKRRGHFGVIKENYDGETESQSFSDESRGGSVSSGSQSCEIIDEKEEVRALCSVFRV